MEREEGGYTHIASSSSFERRGFIGREKKKKGGIFSRGTRVPTTHSKKAAATKGKEEEEFCEDVECKKGYLCL